MFCIHCGTKLPENARFCINCGVKVKIYSEEMHSVQHKDLRSEPLDIHNEQSMSEKDKQFNDFFLSLYNRGRTVITGNSNRMLYVAGHGLFFVSPDPWGDGNRLCFFNENDGKVHNLKRKVQGTVYSSLSYYDGRVYYLMRKSDHYSLVRYDIAQNISEVLKVEECVICGDNSFTHFADYDYSMPNYYNGFYYYCHDDSLYRFSLNTLKSELVGALPDIRSKTLPGDWALDYGYIDISRSDIRSYGEHFAHLYVLDGFGFASLSGGAPATIRFNLKDPSDFDFMPIDTCTASGDLGILYSYKNKLIHGMRRGLHSCGIYKTETEIFGGSIGQMRTIIKGDSGSNNRRFIEEYGDKLWVQRNKVFIGRDIINLDTYEKTSSPIITSDSGRGSLYFVEDNGGGAYVLSETNLKYYPDKWWESYSDKSNYVILDF